MAIKLDQEELAWAGGFFSGEGSTYFRRNKRRNGKSYGGPAIEITQCGSAETLIRFNAAVGNLLTLYGPYYNRANTNRPYWQLSIGAFEKVQAVLAMIWPWLSTIKQEQAANALNQRA
jgi:hypothetical protein